MPKVENLYKRVDRIGAGTIKYRYQDLLQELYSQILTNRDQLPYTKEFNTLYHEFRRRTGEVVSMRSIWVALRNLGKGSKLALEAEKKRNYEAKRRAEGR